jgi:hypothetical protein
VITHTTRPILGIQAGWQLFASGPHNLVDIQFASGTITETAVPSLGSGNTRWLVVGAHEAFIRSADFVPGYVVPDGGPARRLTGAMGAGGPLIPGPRPGEAWQVGRTAHASSLVLTTLTGTRLGPAVALRSGFSLPAVAASDGRGGVLGLIPPDSEVDLGPGRYRPVSGQVLAVGPTRWLVLACPRRRRCRDTVTDPVTGTQRVLPGKPLVAASYVWPPTGVVSPDGALAAVIDPATAPLSVLLVDLRSGAAHQLRLPGTTEADNEAMVWSPDGRWLFVAAHWKLLAVNAHTGQVTSLGIRLPVTQVAVRAAPAPIAGAPNMAMTGGGRSGMDPA